MTVETKRSRLMKDHASLERRLAEIRNKITFAREAGDETELVRLYRAYAMHEEIEIHVRQQLIESQGR
jgi:hypothetical protein